MSERIKRAIKVISKVPIDMLDMTSYHTCLLGHLREDRYFNKLGMSLAWDDAILLNGRRATTWEWVEFLVGRKLKNHKVGQLWFVECIRMAIRGEGPICPSDVDDEDIYRQMIKDWLLQGLQELLEWSKKNAHVG